MRKNPFHKIVDMFGPTPVVVTLPILDSIRKIMSEHKVELPRYSDVFEVLEFLSSNNAIELKTRVGGSHTITNKYVKE